MIAFGGFPLAPFIFISENTLGYFFNFFDYSLLLLVTLYYFLIGKKKLINKSKKRVQQYKYLVLA
jgi:hypothetical protein